MMVCSVGSGGMKPGKMVDSLPEPHSSVTLHVYSVQYKDYFPFFYHFSSRLCK